MEKQGREGGGVRKKGGRGEGRMGGESQRGTSSLAEVIV